MATLRILAFDPDGRPIKFEAWLQDLHLYLLSDARDGVSLYELATGASSTPPASADTMTRSQWLTRDAAARLAICNHLPVAECEHFDQAKTAKTLYDAVVARYSSPATAALSRLFLPYLFPDLSSFATVDDLLAHLRAMDARYRAALPAEFLPKNEPPIYITLHFIVTRLPDSLSAVRDTLLALPPTDLTIDLLGKHLLAAEANIVDVSATRGTPRTTFFEGCSPSPFPPLLPLSLLSNSLVLRRSQLLPLLVGSAAAARAREARVVGVAAGVVVVEVVGVAEVVEVAVGVVERVGASAAEVAAAAGVVVAVVVVAVGAVVAGVTAARVVAAAAVVIALAQFSGSSSSVRVRPSRPSNFVSGLLSVRRLGVVVVVAARTLFAQVPALVTPSTATGVDIFALDFDAIIAGMYALSTSVEGDCYLCAPYDPGIEAAAIGASESALSGTAPAEASHTFTLDSDSLLAPPPWSPLPATPSWHALSPSGLWSSQVSAFPPTLCIPCVEGRQRAAPHSSSFPPTTAPLQTLHMDVWGPARVQGQGRERYFLLVVDDYSRYITVFPLHSKGEVPAVLIPWIRAVRLQLRERFRTDLPVLRLHSDKGGEFSSDLLRSFCEEEGIHQSFTLPASPQQNGIAERRIGLVIEVARTSMIHVAAPHFLWPFAVRYAAHQLNLWPCVSLPETSPILRWMGEVSDASRFRVWGSCAFVRDSTAGKLSSCAIPCVFLGFPTDAPGWQFYHPTSRRVFASQDVTFDESVPFYRLFPYRTTPLPPPPRCSSLLHVPLRIE
ncbi:unnamed protein product [Closterium sp. Yama58-4]|nr:unnamed protein product [Closterium sp. Yama58-4]